MAYSFIQGFKVWTRVALAPTPGGIHKIQVASILRTLGYPSFRDQVRILCWVEVVSLCLGVGGGGGQRQKRISVRHYFVAAPGQRQAGVGVGLGAGGGQRQTN